MEVESKIEADVVDKPDEAVIVAAEGDESEERDYEAEARHHGWTPKEEFKGDPSKWVDAETFVQRADTVMPFLKKQNTALKREIDELKRTIKKSSEFFSNAEQRGYERALKDLETRHDEAVEQGDVAASKRIRKEMADLAAEHRAPAEAKDDEDPKAAQREFAEWVEANDWYVTDEARRNYADIQAGAMGPAVEWEGGSSAWLAELKARVDRKFADRKPNPVNGGGNRGGGQRGSKSFSDLPAEAKTACDKWHRQGVFGKVSLDEARKRYVADYQWS